MIDVGTVLGLARAAGKPRRRDDARDQRNRVSTARLATMPTADLWRAMQRALEAPERAPRLDLRRLAAAAGVAGVADLANPDELDHVAAARDAWAQLDPQARRDELNRIREEADAALTRAVVILRRAARVDRVGGASTVDPFEIPGSTTSTSSNRGAVAQLGAIAGQLHALALDALGRNADFAGATLETLADRVLRVSRKVSRNARGAFEDFWGVSPGDVVGGFGLGSIALLVIAGLVLLTPGGQAALFGWGSQATSTGAGAGAFLSRLGAAAVRVVK